MSMKKLVVLMAALGAGLAAHAAPLAPPGSKGQLRVEYEYSNNGDSVSPSKDNKRSWAMKRSVTITALYAAEKPQPFGVFHKNDARQKEQMAGLQARSEAALQKAQPTMGDMMAISNRCEAQAVVNGVHSDAAFESCVEKAVHAYSATPAAAQMQANGADAASISRELSGTRFQSWKMTSQSGSYSIDETLIKQVYEMTCTDTKICKRTEIRRGGGEIPAPPGGASIAGAFWIEVDAQKPDMVVTLPVPLGPMNYTQTVVTTVPGEKSVTQPAVMSPWMAQIAKEPITVAIPSELRTVSGTKEIKLPGTFDEGGTVQVRWTFTRP
jgi:hypothetical protein